MPTTWEEHALLTNISDRLIELYTKRDDAVLADDFDRADRFQDQIDETSAERRHLLKSMTKREDG
jgi:hypothetical protein